MPHYVDNFSINNGHSLHQREEGYLRALLGIYQAANVKGLEFRES